MAEAFNAAGNLAFKSGDYQTASALYSQAVEVDGKVAKYHTNLCNALLQRGKLFEAILQAAAAITADSSWVKGYYYKALALEQALKLPEALAACQEGLRIHRDNADLLRLHDRVRTHLQELTAQQQRIAAGAAEPVTVVYMASVDDEAGHEQHFRFEHKVDSRRLARAAVDEQERSKIMQEVAMAHHEEMLLAKPWICMSCNHQHGVQQPATKLLLHVMSYLHNPGVPLVVDGPTPACSSEACAQYLTEKAREMAELGVQDAQRNPAPKCW